MKEKGPQTSLPVPALKASLPGIHPSASKSQILQTLLLLLGLKKTSRGKTPGNLERECSHALSLSQPKCAQPQAREGQLLPSCGPGTQQAGNAV